MIQKYYYIVWEWTLGDKKKTVAAAMPFHPLSAITPDKVKDEEGIWDRVVINWQEVPENYYHIWLEGNGMDKNGVRFIDAHKYGPKKTKTELYKSLLYLAYDGNNATDIVEYITGEERGKDYVIDPENTSKSFNIMIEDRDEPDGKRMIRFNIGDTAVKCADGKFRVFSAKEVKTLTYKDYYNNATI